MKSDYIIVGLGNPGQEYTSSRHNVGFIAIDNLAKEEKIIFSKDHQSRVHFCEFTTAKEKLLLLKPQGFMNNSGKVLLDFFSFRKIKISEIVSKLILIHDDSDMGEGRLKITRGGSAGGHKGVSDIISQIGPDFIRIKIGIRPLNNKKRSETFVLSSFTKNNLLTQSLRMVPEIIQCLIKKGLASCQSQYNVTKTVHEPRENS